jgi:TolB-like protein/Tfp pilus assembly protein PilF
MGRFYQGSRGLSPSGAVRDPAAPALLVSRDPVVTGGAVLLADWIEQLRRRRVLRALLAYGVVVFAVLQVIEPVLHGLRLPEWSLSAVVIGLGVGFPLVGTIAWLLDAQRRPASPGAYSARVRHRRLAYGLGALALVAALALGVTLYRGRPSVPATDGPPSIAVLPFANLGGNPEEAYFADGLTEEIQSALAQIPGLRVIGRTSSFAFKGRTQDLKEVARKLGVTSVLEGSVRHSGSRLRITAQIVDARDGYHLWSQSFDREMGDVFAVQDEIGRAVASALQLKLLPRPRGPDRKPVDPEVTNQYLLARRFLARSRLPDFVRAVAASRKAISLDPRFAPAWATLALANAGIGDWVEDPAEVAASQKRAMDAAAQAIAIDPGLAEAYSVRAQMLASMTWDWEGAGEDYDRALALAPGDADILRTHASWYLSALGRLPEAIAEMKKSTGLDPLSAPGWMSLGALEVASGRGDEGERSLARALEIDPDSDYAHQALSVRHLVAGRPEAALAESSRCRDEMWRLRGTALAQHDLGHAAESQAALDELTTRYATPSPYQIAEVHAWRGDRDQAFAWLDKAVQGRDGGLLLFLWDPLLRNLRGDPRFAAIQRQLNLPGG